MGWALDQGGSMGWALEERPIWSKCVPEREREREREKVRVFKELPNRIRQSRHRS